MMDESTPYLGPGAKAYRRADAAVIAAGIVDRVETAIGPYLERSGNVQLEARDDESNFEELAAVFGVSVDELVAKLNEREAVEASIRAGAMSELLTDLMHLACKWDLSFQEMVKEAHHVYNSQANSLLRRLVLAAEDSPLEPPPIGVRSR